MSRRYTVVVHPDEEGGYYISVAALPGCLTQGPTPEVVLERAREAIEAHIEALAKSGLPIPEGDTEPVQVASIVVDVAA
jgi:antitoxin HicB